MYLVELMPKAIKDLKVLPKSDAKKLLKKYEALKKVLMVILKS